MKNNRKIYYYKNQEIEQTKRKKYYYDNQELEKAKRRRYSTSNKEKELAYNKKYNEDHKIENNKYSRDYHNNNRERILKNKKRYKKQRSKIDICFKFRNQISSKISMSLKIKNGKKNLPTFKAIGYSPAELIFHLMNHSEKESWMTINNHGKYNPKTWNDQDQSTWKWNIDHIIPQSDLPYSHMEDENFKKCWALNNLRPLSAKQNLIDGGSRIRHKKAK